MSPSTTIRELSDADLPALAELYRLFWGEPSCLTSMRATFRRLAARPDYLFLAAEDAGRLVGSLLGIVCEELYGACRPFMVVEDVIVAPQQRRQGIGSALMGALEQRAAGLGCSYILFVTESDRTDAHRFYESLGYQSDAYKGFKKRLPRA